MQIKKGFRYKISETLAISVPPAGLDSYRDEPATLPDYCQNALTNLTKKRPLSRPFLLPLLVPIAIGMTSDPPGLLSGYSYKPDKKKTALAAISAPPAGPDSYRDEPATLPVYCRDTLTNLTKKDRSRGHFCSPCWSR